MIQTTTGLSDKIEQFILELFGKEASNVLLLNRKDIANRLECAPSQVTYVVNTRFSESRRFTVESRRGNGGYIKITLRNASPKSEGSAESERRDVKEQTEEDHLRGYYRMLAEYDFITAREYRLLCAVTESVLSQCRSEERKETARLLVQCIDGVLRVQ